jgi:hypothetical protein
MEAGQFTQLSATLRRMSQSAAHTRRQSAVDDKPDHSASASANQGIPGYGDRSDSSTSRRVSQSQASHHTSRISGPTPTARPQKGDEGIGSSVGKSLAESVKVFSKWRALRENDASTTSFGRYYRHGIAIRYRYTSGMRCSWCARAL